MYLEMYLMKKQLLLTVATEASYVLEPSAIVVVIAKKDMLIGMI